MTILEDKLLQYAQNNLNVLIMGGHGIGKTTISKKIAEQLSLKFKYYSASTLDPFADIVGVPVPDKEKKTCDFYRSRDLEDAEFILFDELNRAHPRVLNAVLEIIQFKSVNGVKLPNLKMVWAAINPPGENYQVEELDPALVDRFHCYVKMMPEVNLAYLATVVDPEIAGALKVWWDSNLDDNQKKIFTPRRVEYVGTMISKDLPWRDAIPQGHPFPLDQLSAKLKKLKNKDGNIVEDLEPTKTNIIANPKYFIDKVKENPRLFPVLATVLGKFDADDYYEVKDLLEMFPTDLLQSFIGRKFPSLRKEILNKFEKKGFDPIKYPNVVKVLEGASIT